MNTILQAELAELKKKQNVKMKVKHEVKQEVGAKKVKLEAAASMVGSGSSSSGGMKVEPVEQICSSCGRHNPLHCSWCEACKAVLGHRLQAYTQVQQPGMKVEPTDTMIEIDSEDSGFYVCLIAISCYCQFYLIQHVVEQILELVVLRTFWCLKDHSVFVQIQVSRECCLREPSHVLRKLMKFSSLGRDWCTIRRPEGAGANR